MKIQVVGPGCPRCTATEMNVINACAALDVAAEITHLYDVKEYAKLGIMMTPAVIIDGKVVVSGEVPTVEKLKEIILGMLGK